MSITYETPIVGPTSSSVQVIFKNDSGETYTRLINVPRTTEGTVDEEVFTYILESQLKGVIYKNDMGQIKFNTASIAPTPTP